jgi:hypothetical protein
MMTEFKTRFAVLKAKPRQWFMDGKITFGQAYQFSTKPHRFRKIQLHVLAARHIEHHSELLAIIQHIDYPTRSVDDLMNEFARFPRAIQRAIADGQMTLVQARYARERSFGRKEIAGLTSRNVMDRITSPIKRPVHKAPRDLIPLRRPSSPRHLAMRVR